MPHILIVVDDPHTMAPLAEALEENEGVAVSWAHDGRSALERAARVTPQLVIVDESIGSTSGLEWIRRLLAVNAFIHTAAVSRLPEDTFHEASEGLGIMLQLPPTPGRDEARRILEYLRRMP